MHQRFRRDRQHHQGRDRECAKRDRASIDHDRDQHHGVMKNERCVATSAPDSSR